MAVDREFATGQHHHAVGARRRQRVGDGGEGLRDRRRIQRADGREGHLQAVQAPDGHGRSVVLRRADTGDRSVDQTVTRISRPPIVAHLGYRGGQRGHAPDELDRADRLEPEPADGLGIVRREGGAQHLDRPVARQQALALEDRPQFVRASGRNRPGAPPAAHLVDETGRSRDVASVQGGSRVFQGRLRLGIGAQPDVVDLIAPVGQRRRPHRLRRALPGPPAMEQHPVAGSPHEELLDRLFGRREQRLLRPLREP